MNELLISFFIHMHTTNTHLETSNKSLNTLTPREWEVLLLIAVDIPTDDIADRLHITTASLKTYRARIAEKLIISGRDGLGRYARKNGPLIRDMHMHFYPP